MTLGLSRRTWVAGLAVLAVLLFAVVHNVQADRALSYTYTLQNAATADGNGTAADVGGLPGFVVQVQGTMGGATLTWEGTVDGTNWIGIEGTNTVDHSTGTTTTTSGQIWLFTTPLSQFRARLSSSGGTTNVTVTLKASGAPGIPLSSGGGGGGGGGAVTGAASSFSDGWSVTHGLTTDAKVTGDNPGTINAHLRALTYSAGLTLNVAQSAQNVWLASALSSSIDSVRPIASSGDFADGAMVTTGAIADTAVTGDNTGTVNAHLRGITKILPTTALDTNSGNKSAGTLRVAIATDQPQLTNALLTAPQAITTGGASMDSYICTAAANQDAHTVDASAGTLYSVSAFNTNTAVRWLKIYNTASPTSASTPVLRFLVPPAPASGQAGGFTINLGPSGAAFGTTITMRCTVNQADNDANAVTSGDVVANFVYK